MVPKETEETTLQLILFSGCIIIISLTRKKTLGSVMASCVRRQSVAKSVSLHCRLHGLGHKVLTPLVKGFPEQKGPHVFRHLWLRSDLVKSTLLPI